MDLDLSQTIPETGMNSYIHLPMFFVYVYMSIGQNLRMINLLKGRRRDHETCITDRGQPSYRYPCLFSTYLHALKDIPV